MSAKSKVRKIGNSYGIILPKETLQTLKVKEGDTLYLTEAPENSIRVTVDHSDFAEKMDIVDDLMNRYRNALRELAK
ncbi:MAG TPA: AbrB/MazE/SpoVT family DNA-binding domain-containing protein [Kiritimatiellia bacterium]|nr:AbrB/MazE/SpoVT family DNA-binding domain-containing protein [Kiritimatiellia bacterium]